MECLLLQTFGGDNVDAEEWERRRQAHYETKERGWSTVRESKMILNDSNDVVLPTGETVRQTPSGKRLSDTFKAEQVAEPVTEPVPETPKKRTIKSQIKSKLRKSKIKSALRKIRSEQPVVVQETKEVAETPKKAAETPNNGRTIKSRIKSKLSKIKSEQPVVVAEVVDVEMEAARKKGYDAHMKDKRARELVKAEKQGRRDAMTFKSKRVDDTKKLIKGAAIVAEKTKPAGKVVAKNVGKLMGEAKYTAKAAAKPKVAPPRIITPAAKPQAQRAPKPGPGRREGGLPVRSHKSGPGRRTGGLPVKSTKPGPGHKSNKPGPGTKSGYHPGHKSTKPTIAVKSGYHPGHKSAKPLAQNIPKTAVVNKQRSVHVNKQRSVNFAMRKRSKK